MENNNQAKLMAFSITQKMASWKSVVWFRKHVWNYG